MTLPVSAKQTQSHTQLLHSLMLKYKNEFFKQRKAYIWLLSTAFFNFRGDFINYMVDWEYI